MVYFKALFYYYFGVTGIPTVKREFQSYLVPTLQSVFDNMSQVINFKVFMLDIFFMISFNLLQHNYDTFWLRYLLKLPVLLISVTQERDPVKLLKRDLDFFWFRPWRQWISSVWRIRIRKSCR